MGFSNNAQPNPFMHIRPYQNEAEASIWGYFENGGRGNPFLAMPTGTGKSIIPPLFMYRAMSQYPNQRFLVLTHVKELIEQNYKATQRVWPSAPVDLFSAGLGVKNGYAPIVIGGVATVKNAIREVGRRDAMFIDEGHLLSPNEASMYQTIIAELREFNPHMPVIGLSATPFRMGQGMIVDGGLFTDLIYDITGVEAFNRLIDEYYLSPLIPKRVDTIIDVSDVHELAYDFNQRELHESIRKQNITQRGLNEAWQLAHDRKSWMVFGAGIENCEQITELLNRMGISATFVHSKISKESRENRISAFKDGRFRAIVSNNILTTGFDHPAIDAILDFRPTVSVVLHVQKYGRGTRPLYHPYYTFDMLRDIEYRKLAIESGGKRNCIVLDFAGNTRRLGPINDPRIPRRKGPGTGEIPVKLCEYCGAYNHISARVCIDCGSEFVFRTKIKPSASTDEIIVRTTEPEQETVIETLPVTFVSPGIYQKPGKSPKLQISYFSGMQIFKTWLDFAASGFPLHHAHEWWRLHKGEDFPTSVEEALQRFPETRKPASIVVDRSEKWPKIVSYLF